MTIAGLAENWIQIPELRRYSKKKTLSLRANVICITVIPEGFTVLNHRTITIVLKEH